MNAATRNRQHTSKTFKAGFILAWSPIMSLSYNCDQEGSPWSESGMQT